MTWTRLFYVKNLEKAFKNVVPGRQRTELAISGRYQAEIRKEFRMAGVPWIYNLTKPKTNPRDIRPKTKKSEAHRVIRLDKIQKALRQNEEKEIEYRQERLNKRKFGGTDQMIARGLPSWIKIDVKQIPEYMLRSRSSGGGGDDTE